MGVVDRRLQRGDGTGGVVDRDDAVAGGFFNKRAVRHGIKHPRGALPGEARTGGNGEGDQRGNEGSETAGLVSHSSSGWGTMRVMQEARGMLAAERSPV